MRTKPHRIDAGHTEALMMDRRLAGGRPSACRSVIERAHGEALRIDAAINAAGTKLRTYEYTTGQGRK